MIKLNDDQKNFVRDTIKSEGWKHIKVMGEEKIRVLRKMATQPEVELEKRLWYSAEALSIENFFKQVINLLK